MSTHHRQRKRPTPPLVGVLLMILLLGTDVSSATETVRIPMSMDMELLRALIVDQAYPEPGEQARVVSMNQGCNDIRLSRPQISSDGNWLRFQTDISLYWGTPIAGRCLAPMGWQGSVVLLQQPVIDRHWQLRFQTHDSALMDRSGQAVPLVELLYNLIKEHVHSYLGRITINLAPPVGDLKQFLLSQAIDDGSGSTGHILDSIYPDRPALSPTDLRVDILAQVDQPPAATTGELEEEVISEEAQAKIIALWKSWDAMLVHLIDRLSEKPLSLADRHLLLDSMLTVRYEFEDALTNNHLTDRFVRDQFMQTWQVLRPLFRRHLDPGDSNNLLGYLSFFTAADALSGIDQIGPLLGVEISRAGFYRLAYMLSNETLNEGDSVDPRLRRVLGLEDTLPVPPAPPATPEPDQLLPTDPAPEPPLPEPLDSSWLQNGADLLQRTTALLFTIRAAHAAPPGMNEIREWTAGIVSADQLLPKVQKVVQEATRSQQGTITLANLGPDWFSRMMHATAWQESCFRQFVVKDNKIVYLLSYNNTSVGIMQINEKVWRGIYDMQELRWNIRYNSLAGTEILSLYLNRYIAPKRTVFSGDGGGDERFLAGWLYSLYNGGPRQLDKFPSRYTTNKLYRSDELFLEKFDKTNGSSWLTSVDCLPAL